MIFELHLQFTRLLLVAVFGACWLVDRSFQQQNRVTLIYPLPVTTTPVTFAYPVYNGIHITAASVYVHGEFSTTGPTIKVTRRDGTVVQSTAANALNAYDLLKVDDYIISFGATAGI